MRADVVTTSWMRLPVNTLQIFDSGEVERIADRDHQRVADLRIAVARERQHLFGFGVVDRKLADQRGVDLVGLEVFDERQVELRAHRLEDLVRQHEILAHENFAQHAAVALLDIKRFLKLGRRQRRRLEQDLAELFFQGARATPAA